MTARPDTDGARAAGDIQRIESAMRFLDAILRQPRPLPDEGWLRQGAETARDSLRYVLAAARSGGQEAGG